jgi:hypothetical protein
MSTITYIPGTTIPEVIDVDWLCDKDACLSGIVRFLQAFPDGMMCPSRRSLSKCWPMDMNWLAETVLSDPDQRFFKDARNGALATAVNEIAALRQTAVDADEQERRRKAIVAAYWQSTAEIFCSIAQIDLE